MCQVQIVDRIVGVDDRLGQDVVAFDERLNRSLHGCRRQLAHRQQVELDPLERIVERSRASSEPPRHVCLRPLVPGIREDRLRPVELHHGARSMPFFGDIDREERGAV